MISSKRIYVTKPFLPPYDEFSKELKKIWDNKILTNSGPYHQKFEKELAAYLGVKYISLFTNGTLALLTSLQALGITGEVITTPYSFVATSHSLWWNNIKPVFVDIEPVTFNLDPQKIESAITSKTTAILPVHVYGNPCNVNEIKRISKKHGLKIIYDACHAFGVKINGKSLLQYGDLSVLSFHATKVFNTFEGGAIVSHSRKMKERIDYLKNFGFAGETKIVLPGINAKMSEFNAALGLLQLKYIDKAITARKKIAEAYRRELKEIKGIRFLEDIEGVRHNYSYFPILIDKKVYGRSRDSVYEKLKRHNIYTRRYFYPLISEFPVYKKMDPTLNDILSNARKTSRDILCLPLYPELNTEKIIFIVNLIRER